uniref:DNA annealing helicase and endonuclease ZRANB3 n=1 Tax=Kalanchoe fedtschenkoi TaxID=63787 RepID=A0A7N0TNK9_KALFE
MEITEEQRKRAEASRLAALAKRKVAQERHPCTDFKVRKLESTSAELPLVPRKLGADRPGHVLRPHLPQKFRVTLQICSPDSFCVTPEAVKGFPFPGEPECFRRLNQLLPTVIPSHFTQVDEGGKACVYKLEEYDSVLRCLKKSEQVEFEEIPWGTYNAVERMSHSHISGEWIPCRPEHLPDVKVDELISTLPKTLLDYLLPFQLEGIKFGLRRGGRCLIADDMGLGKTLQAVAIAYCFMKEGSILVVCPAILRFSWAEELERWFPCLPTDIHLVFGHHNNPACLTRRPKVVVISYKMLHHLHKSMLEQEWAVLIVDESHHLRCSKKKNEPKEIRSLLDVASKVKRVVLLSGTPSLSRPFDIFNQIDLLWPGLLGKNKYEFAKTYCAVKSVLDVQGKTFQDFTGGKRLDELNVLLKQTVMIRRLKEHVLVQLPPKRRQIIRLLLSKSDIASAFACSNVGDDEASTNATNDGYESQIADATNGALVEMSYQQRGIAKLSGFCQWMSLHPIIVEADNAEISDIHTGSRKMIIFAHHHKVLDGVERFISEKGVSFVRIDGTTLARDRQASVISFQSSPEVKVAIIGVEAGGFGIDLTSAQDVVFLELPITANSMLQAEDRAHRRGQTKGVNIYIFCAKDTLDESHWQRLNRSLQRVSSTTNGKYDSVKEIEVERISTLEASTKFYNFGDKIIENQSCHEQVGGERDDLSTCLPSDSLQAEEPAFEVGHSLDQLEAQSDTVLASPEVVCIPKKKCTTSEFEIENDVSENIRGQGSNSDTTCGRASEEREAIWPVSTARHTSALDQQHEPNENCSFDVHCLRFEVSRYTGRIHLYLCNAGTDSRPRPLFENFRPDEVEALGSAENCSQKIGGRFIKENPGYRSAIVAFINDWNNLRPVKRKKLFGKPLQLPLTAELCYLEESTNHTADGLLKGQSKRRKTPIDEVSCPLPSDAIWKKVRLCNGYKSKEKEYTQGWSSMDEPLCKLCQRPCRNCNAKTPEYFEDLFCNLHCYDEYRVRTSNRSLRQELFQLEHGVCTSCQLDCHNLVKRLKPLSLSRRRDYIKQHAPRVASRKKLLEKLIKDPNEGHAWHADHIIPVYRGGGECQLDNMRTLCVACHYDVTAAQRRERRVMKNEAKKKLETIVNNFKNDQESERTNSCLKEQQLRENILEEELFIQVAGSAYSNDTAVGATSFDLKNTIIDPSK